ncbi:MAG TPA: TlpA disulfide reductase family protein [Candidatus Baltobacteraceae bacterium]|nr:TlpA disulfide reductase family protein [Candidatus Baltobacteraceae bacterium]
MKYWIGAAIVVAIVLALYFRGSNPHGAGPQALAGRPAASFTVPDVNGHKSDLNAYRGRIVVLNLWASWCPPCRAEMPDLQRLYGAYRDRGVVVIGVDQGESAERAASFAQALSIRYPIWVDDDQQYGRVYAALGLPTTFVIDRNGVVSQGFDGPLSYPQMTQALAPLLKS